MTILEAHSHFAARTDRRLIGCDQVDATANLSLQRGDRPATFLPGYDYWPIMMAAIVQQSGFLELCVDDIDLDSAALVWAYKIERGKLSAGDELKAVINDLAAELLRYGDNDQAHLWQ